MTTTKKPKKLTEAQAKKVLKAISEQFPKWDTHTAKLIPDWYREGGWAVVWTDGAPHEWTMDFEITPTVGNVHCEAYDMSVLCLY